MKGDNLGELEELILLTVCAQHPGAYGVSIREELLRQRSITLSTIHAVLHRLEEKGYLRSELGEATAKRGGKRPRLFFISPYGVKILKATREYREQLWQSIPNVIFQKG